VARIARETFNYRRVFDATDSRKCERYTLSGRRGKKGRKRGGETAGPLERVVRCLSSLPGLLDGLIRRDATTSATWGARVGG